MKTNFPKEKASQNAGGVIKWDPFFWGGMVSMTPIDNHLKDAVVGLVDRIACW